MCVADAAPFPHRVIPFAVDHAARVLGLKSHCCRLFRQREPASKRSLSLFVLHGLFPGSMETPYELNAENRFTGLDNPFEEGVRLFEEGQIADAALCFEAEIARNPENSQVCAGWAGGAVQFCSWRALFGLAVSRLGRCCYLSFHRVSGTAASCTQLLVPWSCQRSVGCPARLSFCLGSRCFLFPDDADCALCVSFLFLLSTPLLAPSLLAVLLFLLKQAWFMLGQSHAENDQDRLAISCLERAVEMDPYSLDALLVSRPASVPVMLPATSDSVVFHRRPYKKLLALLPRYIQPLSMRISRESVTSSLRFLSRLICCIRAMPMFAVLFAL